MKFGRSFWRSAVIAGAIIAIAAASLIYLLPQVNKSASDGTTTSSVKKGPPPVVLPSPSPPSAANLACAPTELKFSGVYNECAKVGKGQSCPAGSFDHARVVLMNGSKHDFLLYIEVNGAYHGPGTYALAPWPHAGLGVPDGVAKVAVRAYLIGGVPKPTPGSSAIGASERNGLGLWESSAGSLTIDNLENGGFVYAGLGGSADSPEVVELNIAGWWSCS